MYELIKEFLDNTRERIKNPLIGTFFISWIIYNWKPIFVIFLSDKKIEDRISYLTTTYTSIGKLLIYPLITTLLYIFLLPYINLLIDKILIDSNARLKKRTLINKTKAIEDESEVEMAKIRLEQLKANYKDKASINEKVVGLESEVKILTETIAVSKERHENEIADINDKNSIYIKLLEDFKSQLMSMESENFKLTEFMDSNSEMSTMTPNSKELILSISNKYKEVFKNIDKAIKSINFKEMNSSDFEKELAKSLDERNANSILNNRNSENNGTDKPS